MPEHDLMKWQALQLEIARWERMIPDCWPPGWESIHGQDLLKAILESEPVTRAGVDAAIRMAARKRTWPTLSCLERWHLRHRISFGVDLCEVGIGEGLPFPQLEGPEDEIEGLMILSWAQGGCDQWIAQMRAALPPPS